MELRKQKLFKIVFLPCLIISLTVLSNGCSESSNDGGITGTGSPLESYLKNGMLASNDRNKSCTSFCLSEPESSVDAPVDDSADGASDESFSRTNTQEQGVDELDWLKTDGKFIYSYNGGSQVNVFEMLDQVGKHAPLNTIPFESDRNYVRGLYLEGGVETGIEEGTDGKQQLVLVSDEYTNVYSDYFWHWHEGRSNLEVYDVTTPGDTIEKIATISIDGQYVSSRKIGSKLYIISQYSAYLDDFILFPYENEEIASNHNLVDQATLKDLLPEIRINGQSSTLLDDDDCLIPEDPKEAAQPTLAIVTEIDLANADNIRERDIKSACIAAPISTIYASLNSVYMVENKYGDNASGSDYTSQIYKLDFASKGPKYHGTVSISGHVGWNEQFRLSEYNDYLRVVTSDWSAPDNEVHRLHTINIKESGLEFNASIPNETSPEPIGKPGEAIYSVRFSGETAYVVTFRQIDPFYVLDLSNHDSPKVAGELELPGFSSYLHPFGEDLVFGLGRGSDSGLGTNNIKLALFDVSEISTPQLVNEIVLQGSRSYTPAEYSHTALSILPNEDENTWRLGFSASIYENWAWLHDAYYLFEVRGKENSQGAGLEALGKILGSEADSAAQSNYYYSSYDRGVLSNTHVHYSHNGSLITEIWEDLDGSE